MYSVTKDCNLLKWLWPRPQCSYFAGSFTGSRWPSKHCKFSYKSQRFLNKNAKTCSKNVKTLQFKKTWNTYFTTLATWTEQGERSTKYFFGLEKSNCKKKSIGKLVDEKNRELFDQFGISNHIVEFYKKLFRSTEPNMENIKNTRISKI